MGREAQLYRARTAVFQPLVLFYLLESIEKVALTYAEIDEVDINISIDADIYIDIVIV